MPWSTRIVFGIADLRADPFERLHHVLAAIAEPRIEHRREARERVDDRQHADLRARRELVVDEVHRPDLVRADVASLAIVPQLRLHPPLRRLVPQLQAQLAVNPMGLASG